MRKFAVAFAILFSALPAPTKEIDLSCVAPGCAIILLQRAQFVENPYTCEWDYIPGKANSGHVLIRGREQRFVVLKIEERGGVEFVIATQEILFEGFGENVGTFCFPKECLANSRAFAIHI